MFVFITLHNNKICLYNKAKVLFCHRQTRNESSGRLPYKTVKPLSVSPNTKADFWNGYILPLETKVYRKSEKYKHFR